jgi:hypothetical protein
MQEDGSPATEDVARGYWAETEDAGLRAQAGAYRFADDPTDDETTQPISPNRTVAHINLTESYPQVYSQGVGKCWDFRPEDVKKNISKNITNKVDYATPFL